jgi:hypothetical protein
MLRHWLEKLETSGIVQHCFVFGDEAIRDFSKWFYTAVFHICLAALRQHLFDQTQAQRKSEMQPDWMGDYGTAENDGACR